MAVLLAMLAVPLTSAFAAEPAAVEQIPDGQWLLGEIWWTPAYVATDMIWLPGERIDSYMFRPATCLVDVDGDCIAGTAFWPFAWGPVGGPGGAWWAMVPAGEQRRMSFAEDWKFANEWGGYYAEFLLPRDEAWFPCSYPLKWKCNFELGPGVFEFHSPAYVEYEGMWVDPFTYVELIWPWVEVEDTVHPVVIDIGNFESQFPYGYEFELEIAGYFWYFSDIE
jgi:hypothetical protein